MKYYDKVQLVAYGTATSQITRVLPPDPPEKTDYQADMDQRATTLCDVARHILTHGGSELAGPDTVKVLVAPEFYFRFGGPLAAGVAPSVLDNSYPHAVNMITKMIDDILVPEFTNTDWNDWIIVAGSVFWHDLVDDDSSPGAKKPAFLNTSIVINGGDLSDDQPGSDTVPTMNRFSTNQKALMSNIDWLLAGGYDPRKFDAALNPMYKSILSDAEYLRWHRFKARGKGNSRNSSPIVFGVEVCLEHEAAGWGRRPNLGVLRLMTDDQPPAPDVQVVTSCGMRLNPSIGVATQAEGVAMLCDGMQVSPGYRWPSASVSMTEKVTLDGVRLLSEVSVPQSFTLPDELQVGYPFGTRTPKDAVSIWTPVNLPNYPVLAS